MQTDRDLDRIRSREDDRAIDRPFLFIDDAEAERNDLAINADWPLPSVSARLTTLTAEAKETSETILALERNLK